MNKSIVSLIASATEIIFALEQQKNLVGRSHGCDYPVEVCALPVLTQATFPITGNSLEIDLHVKGKLANGLSVYDIDQEKLLELSPDVIVTQDQCEVCAASLSDVENVVCEQLGKKTKIVSLKPNCLNDVYEDIEKVSVALDCLETGEQVIRRMRNGIDSIAHIAKGIKSKPRVACIEWIEPMMIAGNWMPELVEMGGAIDVFGKAGEHSRWIEWDDLIAADPEVILVTPCGFGIERSCEDMPVLTEHAAWSGLKAVRDKRVYVIDGDQYCNRPGPRLKDSLEIIVEILHPEVFSYGYENKRWIQYQV